MIIARDDLKRLARTLVSHTTYYGGYCTLRDVLSNERSLRILAYHSISDAPTNSFAVNIKDFEQQMALLAAEYKVISIDDYMQMVQAGQPIPERAVAITIDDGFKDVYTQAFPVFQRYNLPAHIFVPTDFVDFPEKGRKLPVNQFLTWDDIRELRDGGIIIGSHTLDHTSLTKLNPDQIRHQLMQSKRRIEEELGEPITGFSYPYGTFKDFTPEIGKIIVEAGYKWAVAGVSGTNTAQRDPYALRRTKVELHDGLAVFEKSLRGAMDPWILIDRYGRFLQAKNR